MSTNQSKVDLPVGAHYLVPLDYPRPCLISRADSMLGKEHGPYAGVLPEVGRVVPVVARTMNTPAADALARCEKTVAQIRIQTKPLG